MARSNYQAWEINSNEFSHDWGNVEKLLFFAKYAVLAPSGHNSQPWKLEAQKNRLKVAINQMRHLTADGSGLLSAEPYISIGTFLEVFVLAARGFGYKVDVKLFPKEKEVAELSIREKITPEPRLLTAIVSRVSNRNPFNETPINQKILSKITENRLQSVETTVVTDRVDIDFVAKHTRQATRSIMSKPEYRKELSEWVRTNYTAKFDGMPGFTHGFGNLKSLLLLSKVAVRHALKHGPGAEKSAELIRKSAALVIVRCVDNKKESFVNSGRLFSQLCVLAYDSGIAASALGASVLDAHSRENVKQHFKFKDRPLYIIRLGKATTHAPHSPRWPLEKVLT